MKQYYFLCGLPRCGNTFFASLVNQNKDITITANSIIPTLFKSIKPIYQTKEFLTFPNYDALDNVVNNLFDNYYQDFESNIIIDRGPWGTPANLEFLKALKLDTKFIVLKRPVLEILASFVKVESPDNIEKRCDELMSDEGMIGKYLWSYQNLLKTEKVLEIDYDELCNNTDEVLNRFYIFLDLPFFNHNYNYVEQLKIKDIKYNDNVWQGPLHRVREKVKKIEYNYEDYLPESVINKYVN